MESPSRAVGEGSNSQEGRFQGENQLVVQIVKHNRLVRKHIEVNFGHLDNNENPGQADCREKSTAHSESSTKEAKTEKSKCFWKTLKMQPN